MKKLLIITPLAFIFFSCNMELSEEKYREALGKSCNQNFHKLVDQELSDEEKVDFCDCVVDYYVAETDEYTMGSIISMMKNTEEFEANLQSCADQVTGVEDDTTIEDSLMIEEDTITTVEDSLTVE